MSSLQLIQDDELTLLEELGSGAFGRVFVGYWKMKNYKTPENEEMKCKLFFNLN
jgi:hypothetical protein